MSRAQAARRSGRGLNTRPWRMPGRTAISAAISLRASVPEPITPTRVARSGDRYFKATPAMAPVRMTVTWLASIIASGAPDSKSNRWML
jgi:hypothetical protein